MLPTVFNKCPWIQLRKSFWYEAPLEFYYMIQCEESEDQIALLLFGI